MSEETQGKELDATRTPTTPDINKYPSELKRQLLSLTEAQRKFCISYAQHGNGTKAARNAGYSKSVSESWKNSIINKRPELLAIVDRIREWSAKEGAVSVDWTLKKLKGVVEDSRSPAGSKVAALGKILDHLDKCRVPGSPYESLSDADFVRAMLREIKIDKRTLRNVRVRAYEIALESGKKPQDVVLDPENEVKQDLPEIADESQVDET